MTFDSFMESLKQDTPPQDLPKVLEALWHDGKGDWERAHNIAQDIMSEDGSWIHAYLHRKEGDDGNAAYWYRRAGKPMPRTSLEEEWRHIVSNFIEKHER